MTKPIWKRTSNDNPMLSFWGLKAVVFPMKGGRWNYNVLGLPTGPAWGPKFASEAEARAGAEQAFLRAKADHDWATPGREALDERLRAENPNPPRSRREIGPEGFDAYFARLDDRADHETAKAMHFGGCSHKDSSCHSDRCDCWGDGFWVPKSKLFFDEEERIWYILRGWATSNSIAISSDVDEYADVLEHGGDK